jgi:hypothetical protein
MLSSELQWRRESAPGLVYRAPKKAGANPLRDVDDCGDNSLPT